MARSTTSSELVGRERCMASLIDRDRLWSKVARSHLLRLASPRDDQGHCALNKERGGLRGRPHSPLAKRFLRLVGTKAMEVPR